MDLSIIIVSFNTKDVLDECLKSISLSGDKLNKEVIVVDNASTDGSIELVERKYPIRQAPFGDTQGKQGKQEVKIIQNQTNLGYSQGNNIGVKAAKGKLVWLLNSDTRVERDTIQTLFELAVKNRSLIASCKLLNPDGTIQPQGGFIPKLRNITAWMLFIDDIPLIGNLIEPYQQRIVSYFEKDQHPGWLSGTALLVDREFYLKSGGLDEKLFMYGEDVEFCIRAKKLGVRIDYFCNPKLVHIGQASGSSKNAIVGEFKSLLYIFGKHKQSWEMPILKLLLLVGASLRWLLFGVIMGNKDKKEAYGQALGLV